MDTAIFKFNNGNGAILCSRCSVIIKIGKNYTEAEKEAAYGDGTLDPQFCEKCKKTKKVKILIEYMNDFPIKSRNNEQIEHINRLMEDINENRN